MGCYGPDQYGTPCSTPVRDAVFQASMEAEGWGPPPTHHAWAKPPRATRSCSPLPTTHTYGPCMGLAWALHGPAWATTWAAA
eukprot:229293-Chlamydomonas_euryale.AAC.1